MTQYSLTQYSSDSSAGSHDTVPVTDSDSVQLRQPRAGGPSSPGSEQPAVVHSRRPPLAGHQVLPRRAAARARKRQDPSRPFDAPDPAPARLEAGLSPHISPHLPTSPHISPLSRALEAGVRVHVLQLALEGGHVFRCAHPHSAVFTVCSASRLRLLPGFLETRQKLLTMKPTNRMHW